MRRVLVGSALLLLLGGCGGGTSDPPGYGRDNEALLARIPVYPGASAPKTTHQASGDTVFTARDWTLPRRSGPSTVVDWYTAKLYARGWKIRSRVSSGLSAVRRGASLNLGVRGQTLEIIVDAQGVGT